MKRKFLLWYKRKQLNKAIKKCKGLCVGCRFRKPCSEEREQDIVKKVLEENILLHETIKVTSKERDELEEALYNLQDSVSKIKTRM